MQADWTTALGMLFVLIVLVLILRYAVSRDPQPRPTCRPRLMRVEDRPRETINYFEGDCDRFYLAEMNASGRVITYEGGFELRVPKNPYLKHQ